MTHTRYVFVQANGHADAVSKSLEAFLMLIPTQQVSGFDVPVPSGWLTQTFGFTISTTRADRSS